MSKSLRGEWRSCVQCGTTFYTMPCYDKTHCSVPCANETKRGPRCTPEMFWAKVHKGERCWIWLGTKHYRGYGACAKAYGDTRAHRVSWKLTHGPIPKGQGVLHRCSTPLCVNPAHLYLGDQKQNMADCVAAGRRTHGNAPLDQLLHPQLSKRITGRDW